jgi:hypothetical protein
LRTWPRKFKLRNYVIAEHCDQTPAVNNRLQHARYEDHFVEASVYERLAISCKKFIQRIFIIALKNLLQRIIGACTTSQPWYPDEKKLTLRHVLTGNKKNAKEMRPIAEMNGKIHLRSFRREYIQREVFRSALAPVSRAKESWFLGDGIEVRHQCIIRRRDRTSRG